MDHQRVNSKILIKSSFWYTASSFLTKAVSIITIPIFTRMLTKHQYADFSVFASWQTIFLVICGLEIYATLNRARFDYDSESALNSYITSCLVISTIFTGVVFIVYLCIPTVFDKLFLLDKKYMLLMFGYTFTHPAFLMFQAKQRIEYRYKLSSIISFSLIILSTFFSVLLVNIACDKLMGRIVGQYAIYILVGGIMYVYFIIKNPHVTAKNWLYAIKLGAPLVFSILGNQILLSSDRVIVQHICTSEELALLVLSASCAHMILLFVQALNNAWSPWFFDQLKLGEVAQIRKVFTYYMWFVVICTLFVLLFGPEIVMILGGKEYLQSIYILPANMLCGIFTVITAQFVNLQTYYNKTHYAAILTFIVAIFNIIGDIIGVKLFGYQAACYVTVASNLLLIGLYFAFSRNCGVKDIISIRHLLLVLTVSLFLIPLSLFCYQNLIIRIVFIIIIVLAFSVVIYIKRNLILNTLQNIRKEK